MGQGHENRISGNRTFPVSSLHVHGKSANSADNESGSGEEIIDGQQHQSPEHSSGSPPEYPPSPRPAPPQKPAPSGPLHRADTGITSRVIPDMPNTLPAFLIHQRQRRFHVRRVHHGTSSSCRSFEIRIWPSRRRIPRKRAVSIVNCTTQSRTFSGCLLKSTMNSGLYGRVRDRIEFHPAAASRRDSSSLGFRPKRHAAGNVSQRSRPCRNSHKFRRQMFSESFRCRSHTAVSEYPPSSHATGRRQIRGAMAHALTGSPQCGRGFRQVNADGVPHCQKDCR